MNARKHSTAPGVTSDTGKRITQVVMDMNVVMPDTLKFPNHHLCNLHQDNRGLMEQAARLLGVEIEFTAPKPVANRGKFNTPFSAAKTANQIGVCLKQLDQAKPLMEKYRALLTDSFLNAHKQ